MLELVEYQPDTVTLTDDEADELTAMTTGAGVDGQPKVIQRLSKAGRQWRITPGPFVGRFRLRSGRAVTIAGRFPFQDLAVLLGLGRRAVLLHDTATAAGGGTGLLDLIALAYAREAELVAGKGLLKVYERKQFTRPPYPGTPSATAHFRAHAGRPDRLATTASRLTSDVPLNRVVATALRRLFEIPYTDPAITARLRGLLPVFRAVTGLTGPPPAVHGVPSHYLEVYELARLVLGWRTALPTDSGVLGASVLFKMTDIWEAYAERWLSRRRPGHEITRQHLITLIDSGPPRPGSEPTWCSHGRPAIRSPCSTPNIARSARSSRAATRFISCTRTPGG